jgi:Family of unknown function (DUF6498)
MERRCDDDWIAAGPSWPQDAVVIASLVANLVSLGGLLFLGWSVWMAVAIYWLENLLTLPAIAVRIRRAFPLLSDRDLEAYLAGRESERSGGVTEASRLRAALAARGRVGAAGYAARRFLTFYGVFALAHGLFVFVLGSLSSVIAADDAEALPDLGVFDWPALALAALLIAAAEIVGLRLDRRPIMPDVGAYTRRMIVLHVTIILGALALTMFGSVALAIFFIALKTLADLGLGARARGALDRRTGAA